MKHFLAALSLCCLALAGCEKKESKPVVANPAAADTALSERPNSILQPVTGKPPAGAVPDAVSQKMTELKLSSSDITAELAGTGRVVREKTVAPGQQFGEAADNERLVTVINSKLVADPELSGLRINVEVDRGVATLKGSVKSAELIGRATLLALETQGIRQAISLLALDPNQ